MIDVSAASPQAIEATSKQLGIGFHLGALVLILAFSIFNYVAQPSTLLFRFLWLIVDLLLCVLSGSGMLAEYVFTEHLWQIVYF